MSIGPARSSKVVSSLFRAHKRLTDKLKNKQWTRIKTNLISFYWIANIGFSLFSFTIRAIFKAYLDAFPLELVCLAFPRVNIFFIFFYLHLYWNAWWIIKTKTEKYYSYKIIETSCQKICPLL